MAKLILHLGTHRTGSTAIQESLAANTGRGFVFPLVGDPPFKPHHEDSLDQIFSTERFESITSSTIPMPERNRDIREKSKMPMTRDRLVQLAANGRDKIRQAATAAGDGIVVLSGEGAYRYLSVKDLSALKNFAEELFDDIQVVAYVRNPFDLVSSTFHNAVMNHKLSKFHFKYRGYGQLKKFDEVFGRDRVDLWKYDRTSFPDGDVVLHFCEKVGLPSLTSAEVNATGSRPAVSAVYRLNRLNVGDSQIKDHRTIVNVVRRSFPHQHWPKLRLCPRLVRPLIDAAAPDLDWIEERIGCSLRIQPEQQENDVREESDLLQIGSQARTQLLKLGEALGKDAARLLERALPC